MSEMHPRQSRFMQNTRLQVTENKTRKQKLEKKNKTGDSRYIYRNELGKDYFQYDMAYGDFTNLSRRTVSDKVIRDWAFKITSNIVYQGYQRGFASMV